MGEEWEARHEWVAGKEGKERGARKGKSTHASVDPENEGVLLRVLGATLEEPVEEVSVVGDVEVTAVRLGGSVANALDVLDAESVAREFGVLNELIWKSEREVSMLTSRLQSARIGRPLPPLERPILLKKRRQRTSDTLRGDLVELANALLDPAVDRLVDLSSPGGGESVDLVLDGAETKLNGRSGESDGAAESS
jgi:hypothetical protein